MDLITGGVAGMLVGVAYVRWLAPFHELLQRSFGDYVPPGSVLPTISNSLGVFFVANLVLAPFVEETIYRGIALPLLKERYGARVAIPIVCVFFGLLHWAGGIWYIALTGLVAGALFATLFIWGGGIYAPFAAHLALNIVEFVYASRLH
ncbi:MAG: CPBP family intramembrane glutamic endopeptidase [Vicinamibacterales bacterium]